MCYNCGCAIPEDDMGSVDNITESTLMHLSEHWGKNLTETKKELLNILLTNDPRAETDQHLKDMFEKASKAWGQSIEDAKKNTAALLKTQVG